MWGSLFLLIALVFSRSIQVQFTLPKLLVLRTFARLLRSAASIVIVSAVFPIATYREVRADGLHFEMLGLDPSRDWARIEQAVDASLEIAQGDSYYLDAAGLQYLKRLQVTGQKPAYEKAAALFDDAAQRDPFNPMCGFIALTWKRRG